MLPEDMISATYVIYVTYEYGFELCLGAIFSDTF